MAERHRRREGPADGLGRTVDTPHGARQGEARQPNEKMALRVPLGLFGVRATRSSGYRWQRAAASIRRARGARKGHVPEAAATRARARSGFPWDREQGTAWLGRVHARIDELVRLTSALPGLRKWDREETVQAHSPASSANLEAPNPRARSVDDLKIQARDAAHVVVPPFPQAANFHCG